MSQTLQPGTRSRRPTALGRWYPLLFALLFAALSVAQAAHTHGSLRTHSAARVDAMGAAAAGDADETCPLCQAMHSAVPVRTAGLVLWSLSVSRPVVAAEQAGAAPQWSFSLFGRPPPAR